MQSSANARAPVKLAIVGCGAITRASHLPSLARIPGHVIKSLCDVNIANARLTRAEFDLDCEVTSSVAEVIGKVDAAIIATPPKFHAPVARQLLEAGIDILCEKPLASSAAEAREMVETADRHGRILAVGLVTRYHPNNALLRELADDDFLGELTHVAVEFGAPLDWPMATDAYYRTSTTAGGVLYDAGVHFIDRMAWLFGDLTDISMCDDSFGGFESNALVSGQLTIKGQLVPCSAAFSWTHLLDNCIRLTGTAGTAEVKMSDPNHVWLAAPIAGKRRVFAISDAGSAKEVNPYEMQLVDFLTSVQTRTEPTVPGKTAILALDIIERAYATRKPMPQPWVEAFE